jgi:hypothetical protein
MRSWRPHSGRTTHRRGNYRDKRDERRAWSQARAHQAPGRTREARAAKRLPRTLSALAACTASAGPRSSGFPYGAGAHRKGRRAGRHLEPGRNPSRRRYPPPPGIRGGATPYPLPAGSPFIPRFGSSAFSAALKAPMIHHLASRAISWETGASGLPSSSPCVTPANSRKRDERRAWPPSIAFQQHPLIRGDPLVSGLKFFGGTPSFRD